MNGFDNFLAGPGMVYETNFKILVTILLVTASFFCYFHGTLVILGVR